jgi:hypothetical protein
MDKMLLTNFRADLKLYGLGLTARQATRKDAIIGNYKMINKYLLFIGLFLLPTILCGQTFNEKYFIKTNWFSNNNDSTFAKADTLIFIKHSNWGPEWAPKEYAESEVKYLKHGNYVEFGFKKHRKLDFDWRYHNSMGVVPAGQWTWAFDKKTNQLKIYNHFKVLVDSFQPLSERQIKIESSFAEQKDLLSTTE